MFTSYKSERLTFSSNQRNFTDTFLFMGYTFQPLLQMLGKVNIILTDQKKISDFKIANVVLVHVEHLRRGWWNLGKVTNTFIGRDGRIRSCEVKTNISVIKQLVNLISNLEFKDIKISKIFLLRDSKILFAL